MSNDLDSKIEAIRDLLAIFRFERMVYLFVTIISLIMLLSSAAYMMLQGDAGIVAVTGLFGSAGAITYTAGRLLRMWSQAIQVLFPAAQGGNE